MLWTALLGPLSDVADTVLKRVLPAEKMSEEDRAKFKAQFEVALMSQENEQMKTSMSAIIMEAKSGDKWTSRARPSFLYVMYALILFAIPYGVTYIFAPAAALDLAAGMKAWLGAIPEMLWGVFGAGYLGYAASRSFDKRSIMKAKKETW